MTAQKMKVFDAMRPLLQAGAFAFEVCVEISKDGAREEQFTRQQLFRVEAPQDRLGEGAVSSVFPPAGHSGKFSQVLPYIVLNDPTLPWQRAADRASTTRENRAPWLALIMLDEADSAAVTVERRATASGAGTVEMLTIPGGLAKDILPSYDALGWLTHVRRVDILDKPTTKDGKPPGRDYSVIVCNRLPAKDGAYTAHLVSLEGLEERLPKREGPVPSEPFSLYSLHNWRFTVEGANESFVAHLRGLDFGPLALPVRLPPRNEAPPPAGSDAAFDLLAARAMAQGFCALTHHLRSGARTVSWYRGPLLPVKENPRLSKTLEWNGAALMGYDASLGMFDVGLASAWQLGRMLALAAPEYSRALYRWRGRRIQEEVLKKRAAMGELTEAELAGQRRQAGGKAESRRRFAAYPAMQAAVEPDKLLKLLQEVAKSEQLSAVAGADTASDEKITKAWLSGLYLLKGVPLHYLVPDAGMLPEELMRFFRIDRNWIEALLSGALSIGGDYTALKTSLREELRDAARAGLGDERFSLMASAGDTRPEHAGEAARGTMLSGFLIRSKVVTAYPGVEVKVLGGPSGAPLEKLRMELVASDILLCLYDDEMVSAEFIEPAEGPRFAPGDRAKSATLANGTIDIPVFARQCIAGGSGVAAFVKAVAAERKSVVFKMKASPNRQVQQ